jgi:quercetin dioxygenase-like cupin family protein
MRSHCIIALSAFAALAASSLAAADPIDVHLNVPRRSGLEVNVVEHDIAPGQSSGWHIHRGTEIAYVLSGEINLQLAGGPIRHLVKGDHFEVERGMPHRATNDGKETAALLITYLKDKRGPWKIPVPAPSIR